MVVLVKPSCVAQVDLCLCFGDCFEKNIKVVGAEEELPALPPIYLSHHLDDFAVQENTQRGLKVEIHRAEKVLEYSWAETSDFIIQRFYPTELHLHSFALPLVHPLLEVHIGRVLIEVKHVMTCEVNIFHIPYWIVFELHMGNEHPS